MLARLPSASLRGLDAEPVTVEVDLSRGIPGWSMVGLADTSVREAKDRVRAALLNAGFTFPLARITINLAPADRKKIGAHFDLPVAVGILHASGQIPSDTHADPPFLLGELGLDGALNPVAGVLPLAIFARRQGVGTIIVPEDNAVEAAIVPGLRVIAARHLLDVARHLNGTQPLPEFRAPPSHATPTTEQIPDMADVRGQHQARRALEIAACGRHPLLMSGSPGVGKSMLAVRMPGIMPPLNDEEAMDVARIRSILGERSGEIISHRPPIRSPHHTCSEIALIGGGHATSIRPGEISRAHLGILFLDELPEFRRSALESLRQPLEQGEVTIARAADAVRFPARFQLIAAMNPCPCGYLDHPRRACRCSQQQIQRYRHRISGPLLDRFDLRIHLPAVEQEDLESMQPGEPSAPIRARVTAARERQIARQGCCNAELAPNDLEQVARPDEQGAKLLRDAMQRFALSARSYHRLLKVARTIADLGGAPQVSAQHIAEALQFREELLPASGTH